MVYLNSRLSGEGVLRRFIIAATIVAIFCIFANRFERCGIVIGILGAGISSGGNILIMGVGAGNSNNLAGDIIFRNLFLRFSSVVSSRIIYIFNYTLISRRIGVSEY